MNSGASALASPDEETRRAAVAELAGGDDALAALVVAMGDASWRVRKEAVVRAAAWPEPARAAAALTAALSEPENVGRRNAAVEALARLGEVACGPLLEALARRPEHRKLLVDTLGLVGDARAVAGLVPALDDADPNVRSAAAESLGRLGGAQAEAALLARLAAPAVPIEGEANAEAGAGLVVAVACLEALIAIGARVPVDRLLPLCRLPASRPAALAALGLSRDAAAASALTAHLGDRSRSVRQAATIALGRLVESLPAGEARGEARRAIAATTEEAEQLLVTALLEGGVETRRAAAIVIGQTGRARLARPLALALGDPAVEPSAAAALAALGPRSIDELALFAHELDPSRRAALFRAMASFAPDSRVEALLIGELGGDDPDAASEAARALGDAGTEPAIDALWAALARGVDGAEAALCRLAERHPAAVRARVPDGALVSPGAAPFLRVVGACRRTDDVKALLAIAVAGEPSAASAADDDVRAAAVEALAACAGAGDYARVRDAFAPLVVSAAPRVRASIARALANLPPARSLPLLERLAADADEPVRAAAARSLGLFGVPEAFALLRAREREERAPLVRAVISAGLAAARA